MNADSRSTADAGSREQFMQAFRGSFTSALRWHHLDALWGKLSARAGDGWYIYTVGEVPPEQPADADQVQSFIDSIDRLLREEHEEDYCGIVYADDLEQPAFVKIYHPKNLGVSCGSSDNPPLPGWLLTHIRPYDLASAQVIQTSRKHWWQRVFPK